MGLSKATDSPQRSATGAGPAVLGGDTLPVTLKTIQQQQTLKIETDLEEKDESTGKGERI